MVEKVPKQMPEVQLFLPDACVHPSRHALCPCIHLCRLNSSGGQTDFHARTLCFLKRESQTLIMWPELSRRIKTLISRVYPFSVFMQKHKRFHSLTHVPKALIPSDEIRRPPSLSWGLRKFIHFWSAGFGEGPWLWMKPGLRPPPGWSICWVAITLNHHLLTE